MSNTNLWSAVAHTGCDVPKNPIFEILEDRGLCKFSRCVQKAFPYSIILSNLIFHRKLECMFCGKVKFMWSPRKQEKYVYDNVQTGAHETILFHK